MAQETTHLSLSSDSNSSTQRKDPVEPINLVGTAPSVGPLTPRGNGDLTPRTAAQGTQMLTPRSIEAAKRGAEEADRIEMKKYGVTTLEAKTWGVHFLEKKKRF